MNFLDILKISGILLVLGVIVYAFFKLACNIVSSIKARNFKWLINALIITVLCLALCIFLIKPFQLVEKLLQLF